MLLEAQFGLSLIFSLSLSLGPGFIVAQPKTPTLNKTQTRVLESLIFEALSSHPSQKSQSSLVQSAQAGLDSARWQFYPTPSVTFENARTSANDSAYAGDNTVTNLRLQQPLWTGGRLTAGLKKAEANVTVTRAAQEDTRQQLALRVVQNYGDWLGAYLKILANEKSMATHIRLHEQVKRRIQQGLSSDSDLTQAVTRLESLVSDIAVARAQQDIAEARLGQLVGRPVVTNSLRAALASPHALSLGLPMLLVQAQATNPSIQKARAQASVQESVIAERRADFLPEVYLRAEQQYGNYAYRNAPSASRLFIGLSSKFGPGMSSRSELQSAQLQHQAYLEEINVQALAVSEQVLTDFTLVASSQVRLTSLETSLNAAQEVSNSYERQFLAGKKTWLDVMNAARELAQTESQLADTESTQLVVTWRLAITTQGLSDVMAGQP